MILSRSSRQLEVDSFSFSLRQLILTFISLVGNFSLGVRILIFEDSIKILEKKNSKAIPAATIMIGRQSKGELQVLLVQRNKSLAFAGGAWVYPGGKIEDQEIQLGKDQLDAAKLAAVRETKEETGLSVSKDELIFFRHWTTPAREPRRFATWFFFGSVSSPSEKVIIDNSEIKSYRWIHPQEALDELKRGKIFLMPPTFLSMLLIRKCDSLLKAREILLNEPVVHVRPVMCRLNEDFHLLYEGDAGYQSANPNLKGSRHRLILNPGKGIIEFEHSDCKDHLPITGGDMFFS